MSPTVPVTRRFWVGGGISLALTVAVCVWAGSVPAGERSALGRTIGMSLVAGATAFGFGLAYALVLARLALPGRRTLRVLGLFPLVIPPYLSAIAWVGVFGPAGFVPDLLGLSRPQGPPTLAASWVFSWPSAGFLLGACWFPLVALAASAALRRVPASALDAARLARGRAGERRVLFAAAFAPTVAAALAVAALAAVELAVPQLLRVRALSEFVFAAFGENNQLGKAFLQASLATLPLLLLVAAAVTIVCLLPLRLLNGDTPAEARAPTPLQTVLGLGLLALLLAPGLILPAVSLLTKLGRDPTFAPDGGALARGWSVLSKAWSIGRGDAGRSLELGLWTASVGLVLGCAIAWPLRRASARVVVPLAVLLALVAACPAPLVGIGVVVTFDVAWPSFLDSLAAVGLTCLIRFGPLALVVIWLVLRAVPRSEEEAAALAGRHAAGILLPRAAIGLAATWVILYVLTVTEYGATAIVNPAGKSLLAMFVVNEAHYGQGSELTGLCALLIGVAVAPLPFLALATRLIGRRA